MRTNADRGRGFETMRTSASAALFGRLMLFRVCGWRFWAFHYFGCFLTFLTIPTTIRHNFLIYCQVGASQVISTGANVHY
jgi:hypothetical protein